MAKKAHYKVIIIGSGAAGLTAALYTARANLEPLVIEGIQPGGQLTITTEVENFPGFPEGIQGPELMDRMHKQVEKFDVEFLFDTVTDVDLQKRPFTVKTEEETLTSDTLIVATGATARLLGLESEAKMMGHGVSACATCDGFFFAGKEIVVVGGGDSAMEEATFLTKFASKVTVVHRRDKLRASAIMQEKAFKNEKIDFLWNKQIIEILGEPETGVEGIRMKDTVTGEESTLACEGVFMAIGHVPNTQVFKGQLETDNVGYLITKPKSMATSVEGVFAAGDVQDSVYRQAISAAGSGCMAALDAQHYLEELEYKNQQ